MPCTRIHPRLGELLDGELPDPLRREAELHLRHCPRCRDEYQRLSRLAAQIATAPPDAVPRAVIWSAIERRLDTHADHAPDGSFPRPPSPEAVPANGRTLRVLAHRWRPLASAAAVLLATGLGWAMLAGPWNHTALAGQIDFRPLLAQADGDIQAGIRALIAAHGGRPVTRNEANRLVRPRVHAPAALPDGLRLKAILRLNLGGDHWSIGYHYSGPAGELLLLQCPPMVKRDYGGYECLPCKIAGDHGQIARVGKRLRLAHFMSPNVCVCVVSTLDEHKALPDALDAVQIDF